MQIQIEESRKEIKQHGNYAFPVNVSIESIQAYERGNFLWHWHPEVELTLILSGKIEYRVNDAVYILTEGDGLFGTSNTLHSGYQIGDSPCTYLSITFHPMFLYGYEGSCLQTDYVNFITENETWASAKLVPDGDWQDAVFTDMREIYRMSENPPADYTLQVHILLLQIWLRLYRFFSAQPDPSAAPSRNIERLRAMLAWLQEHYAQDVSLDDLAASVNICKSECCRFFKKHMNMTILDYLMELRIRNSLPLLRRGESVTRTAGMVGFSGAAYFGQIFKRYMHCTPREYRTRAQHLPY